MTNRAFADLVDRVQPMAPMAPRPLILQHIRRAARTVCEKTLSWRYMIPLFDLLPGVHEYAFNTPAGSEVEHVFGVLVNGRPLELLTLDDAIFRYPDWADLYSGEDAEEVWSETPGGYLGASTYNESLFNEGSSFVLPESIVADASTPRACCMVTPQRFIILPLPDARETYTTRMFVSLKPTKTAVEMNSEALDELEDAIVYKAISTLLAMPGKPWFNGDVSSHNARLFRDEYLDKKRRANLGHVRGSMSVRMRAWA